MAPKERRRAKRHASPEHGAAASVPEVAEAAQEEVAIPSQDELLRAKYSGARWCITCNGVKASFHSHNSRAKGIHQHREATTQELQDFNSCLECSSIFGCTLLVVCESC